MVHGLDGKRLRTCSLNNAHAIIPSFCNDIHSAPPVAPLDCFECPPDPSPSSLALLWWIPTPFERCQADSEFYDKVKSNSCSVASSSMAPASCHSPICSFVLARLQTIDTRLNSRRFTALPPCPRRWPSPNTSYQLLFSCVSSKEHPLPPSTMIVPPSFTAPTFLYPQRCHFGPPDSCPLHLPPYLTRWKILEARSP